jgi:hypothetical protein
MHATVDLDRPRWIGAVLSCLVTLPLGLAAVGHPLAICPSWRCWASCKLAVPCMLMGRAARHLQPHEIALIGLLEVVLGPIWAWLGANEAMGPATVQGV